MRPIAIVKLLKSLVNQSIKPSEVLIIDGSTDNLTKSAVMKLGLQLNLIYYKVGDNNRGLTKQRNFGISKCSEFSTIVAFLDDDIVLEPFYFHNLLKTYIEKPKAIGVGGIDLQSNRYFRIDQNFTMNSFNYYVIDGWAIKEPLRYKLRKIFGLMPKGQPDIIPQYSHGRSGFPPNNKTYKVEHMMGGISSFRRSLFDNIQFSEYFVGYGLYEDFDFCVRSLDYGDLYINTAAQVWHYHEISGRPNTFKYGIMVVRNGWYVWKQKFPNPSLKATFQWHFLVVLMTIVRLSNVLTKRGKKKVFMEFLGRITGWWSLIFSKPSLKE